MLTNEVVIGERYWTRVGEAKVEVVVWSKEVVRNRTRFGVRRLDNNNLLPKARTAAALHKSRDFFAD